MPMIKLFVALYLSVMLVSGTWADRLLFTPIQGIEYSDVIVYGHIESITEGRILHNIKARYKLDMYLVKFKVDSVMKGDVGEYVYFEDIKGGRLAEKMHARRNQDRMLILLKESGWANPKYYTVEYPDGNIMNERDALYSVVQEVAVERPLEWKMRP